ncbi:MAG TPA: hypothetical protein VFK05_10465 [Polyangiaceae bacterium]|nr:hypothetical protein [Polyangiaceae bacterium]
MTRALRFLALFTALLVVSVRCLSGLPLVLACAALPDLGQNQVCLLADDPREEDTLAPVAVDDADDDTDALLAPSPPRVRLLTYRAASGLDRGALAADLALASHARGLERPPRG